MGAERPGRRLSIASNRQLEQDRNKAGTNEEEDKEGVMPRYPVWMTRLVDGPQLTTEMRKSKSLFSQLAFTKCLLF